MTNRGVTRCRKLVENIKPLAEWLKANKPQVKDIHVFKADWLWLIKASPETIRAHGFNITAAKGVTYDGFTLRPVEQKVNKG